MSTTDGPAGKAGDRPTGKAGDPAVVLAGYRPPIASTPASTPVGARDGEGHLLPLPPRGATSSISGHLAAGFAYRRLGWPVTLHAGQLSLDLDLDVDAVALLLPTPLSTTVTDTLLRRRCPPPVLAHPALPTHRVIVAGERYGVPLAWPTEVHRVTTTLLLPPTVTTDGPLFWVRPPVLHALRLCREIDVFTALRAVLTTPPPEADPDA